jgi:serine/threonine protein phosphatase PrpC
MGNLLGSPVTDKETHTGETTTTDSGGNTNLLKWGLSSMQGWRVHMEDAHIAECNLYAVREKENFTTTDTSSSLSSKSANATSQNNNIIIPLPGHALFACFDGHGGTFSAEYAGRNFLRILSKQPKFVEYAEAFMSNEGNNNNSNHNNNNDNNNNNQTVKQSELHLLLEHALQQAFVETDFEIALAIRGEPHPHANQLYHYHNSNITAATASSNHDDVIMKQSVHDNNDDTSNDDTMRDAAGRAAANHVQALDDDGDSGTTACIVLVTPSSLVCANAGDSRAVFSRKNFNNIPPSTAVPLSFDHKPDDEMEERRIRAAGGYVAGGRVGGDLAVSRGLGDFRFKDMRTVLNNTQLLLDNGTTTTSTARTSQTTFDNFPAPGDQKVSPIPDIVVHTRIHSTDEFVVVACDGIWDVQSNQDCVQEIHAMIQEGETNLGLICEEVCHIVELSCVVDFDTFAVAVTSMVEYK